MNEIVQHIPAFVDYREAPPRAEFSTLAELLAIPWVKRYADTAEDFHQFSLSGTHLIVESRGGHHWWVVGYLRHPVDGLPEWNKGIHEVWDNGEVQDISGTEVSSVCGDEVTLKGGRVLKQRKHP